MTRLLKGAAIATATGGGALLLLGMACHAAGARVNTSGSIPLGLYWTSDAPVGKGAYVLFCPPQASVFEEARRRGYIGAGFCPGGYGYLMKRVLGATGDAISIADDGVRVNGELLPFSARLRADGGGRPMPRYRADSFTLSEHQVLLMSDANPRSFDARYFGPVQRNHIKTVILPVMTWQGAIH
jgi:conjugative transfer signal peptidase TraF